MSPLRTSTGLVVAVCVIAVTMHISAVASGTSRLPPEPTVPTNLPVDVSLAFTVTVCLDEVDFSIACRQRGLLEVQRRLEQILLDDYANGNTTGDLRVAFWLEVEGQDQVRLLREAEIRAIEAVTSKLQSGRPSQYALLREWHDAAQLEAISGRNWKHDWAARTHQYQIGPSRYRLAHFKSG